MEEIIIVSIDIVLLICGLLTAYYVKHVGGDIGHKNLRIMVFGFLFFGFAHIIETMLVFFFPDTSIEILELSHRVLVLVAMILILIGYSRLAKFVKS